MFTYEAKVLRVIDGDTLDLEIDLGFRVFVRERVRLYGIDTPETYGVKKGSDEWQSGTRAKAFVEHWLATHTDRFLTVQSHDGKKLGTGKYGRWLAVVSVVSCDLHAQDGIAGTCRLNDALVQAGHSAWVTY